MKRERPVTYQPYTWSLVVPRLEALPEAELAALAARAGAAPYDDSEDLIDALLHKGGFLLAEFGLIYDPEATRGTYFMHDIFELLIDEEGARQLARGEDVVVRHVGGDFFGVLSAEEVVRDLRASDDFDQKERR